MYNYLAKNGNWCCLGYTHDAPEDSEDSEDSVCEDSGPTLHCQIPTAAPTNGEGRGDGSAPF